MNKTNVSNWLLVAGVVGLAVIPLIFVPHGEFSGADGEAEKAITEIQRDALKLIGVDEIVCPEIQTATQLADSLYSEFSNLVRLDPQFAIGTIKAPHDFIDKTVHEIQLYEQFKINCIAIKRDDEYITAHPQHIILEDDELVVAGKYNKLRAIIEE